MKIVIDNQIASLLKKEPSRLLENPFFPKQKGGISFRWPTLLVYLDLGSIFFALPPFEQNTPLFDAYITALHTSEEKENLFYLYDTLFAENLTQIQSLALLQPSFLLEAIKKQGEKSILSTYEKALEEKTSDTMHDLILYLAWDRMCVCMNHLFNHQSMDAKFLQGIEVFKECLIESYQHITEQGRTSPGFYRLLEALFFYQMREERLYKHTQEEWSLLTKSFPALQQEKGLVDAFYIDDAVGVEEKDKGVYLTMDSSDRVQLRFTLAGYMIDRLKKEIPGWKYNLYPQNVMFLE
jgi:hypothetical protein